MKHGAVRLGSVHIIESLGQDELPTGERLFRWLKPIGTSATNAIDVHFWRETGARQLLARLQHIANDVHGTQRPPVLQMEVHGNRDGIGLSSGEFLTWEQLKGPLTLINMASRLNLVVLMAACDGAGLGTTIQLTDRAPVWAIIGPERVVTDVELDVANRAFYQTLFETRNGVAAYRAINDCGAQGDRPFLLFHAETMFKWVMQGYFRDHCNDEALRQRDAKGDQLERAMLARGASPAAVAAAKRDYRIFIRDHEALFARAKTRFFACDLYPEHHERFSVAIDECFIESRAARYPLAIETGK